LTISLLQRNIQVECEFVKAHVCVLWDNESALIDVNWDKPCAVFAKNVDAMRAANMQGIIDFEVHTEIDN